MIHWFRIEKYIGGMHPTAYMYMYMPRENLPRQANRILNQEIGLIAMSNSQNQAYNNIKFIIMHKKLITLN